MEHLISPLLEYPNFNLSTNSTAANIGNVIMLLVSGIIAEHWGWPAIFYVCGVCGLLWVALWWYFGSNSPEEYHKKISEEEKNYIQSSIGQITDVEELKVIDY